MDGLVVNALSYSVWLCLTRAIVRGEVLRRRTGLICALFSCELRLRALFLAHQTSSCLTAMQWRIFFGMKCSTSLEEMIQEQGCSDVFVCGIATDVCVGEITIVTAKPTIA